MKESCGSLVKAQASAQVDVPTASNFFCSTDQGVQHLRTSFIMRKLGYVLDGQPTVIVRVSAMKR